MRQKKSWKPALFTWIFLLFGNLIIDVHIVDQSNRNGRYQQAGSAITDERKSDSSQRHQAGRTSDIDDSLYQEHRTDPRTDQLGKRIFNFDRILKNAIDHIEKQHQNERHSHQA